MPLAPPAGEARRGYLRIHFGQLVLQLVQLLRAEALEDGVLVDVPGVRHGCTALEEEEDRTALGSLGSPW